MSMGWMKVMFPILWFMVLCMSVGALEDHTPPMGELGKLLEDLLFKYPGDISSSKAYPEKSTVPSKSSDGWSTAETTSRHYEATSPESSTVSSKSSHGYSTADTTRHYETSQPDKSERYTSTGHPHHSSTEGHGVRIGSIRGIPGINFPDYTEIPLTSFSCSDKDHVPGFYADMETGCQVFHVCWPHRRESFLCPIGTKFNQAILACDYWYSCNCSMSSHYYDVNVGLLQTTTDHKKNFDLGSMVNDLLEKGHSEPTRTYEYSTEGVSKPPDTHWSHILKFLPVKTKVVVYPQTAEGQSKIVAEASVGRGKHHKGCMKHMHDMQEAHKGCMPVEPEYTSPPPHTQQRETPASKVVSPKITPKNSHEKDSHEIARINRIIDHIFEIAKKIVREAEGLLPILEPSGSDKNAQKAVPGRKPLPLPKLNPRFITKPAEIPKQVKYEKSTVRPVEETKTSKAHPEPTPVTRKPQYKEVENAMKSKDYRVSPQTKEVLLSNFLRLYELIY